MRRIRNLDEDRIASVLNDSESTLPVDQESSQDINTEDEDRSVNYEYHDNLNDAVLKSPSPHLETELTGGDSRTEDRVASKKALAKAKKINESKKGCS